MLRKMKKYAWIFVIGGFILFTPYDVNAETDVPVIVESWQNLIKGEDSEVRKMFDIYDKNQEPNMGQRLYYCLTKTYTNMINDITGTNELSYGAGGHIFREKIESIYK